MNHWTDEDLYKGLVKAERRDVCFQYLYGRHSGALFRFIYRFTLDKAAAEELLHDVFVQLLSGKLDPESSTNVKSWLFTVAKNMSLNYSKKSKREIKNEDLVLSAVSDESVEGEFQTRELMGRLAVVENQLPEDLSRTSQLRKEGLDYQEIADRLSIPVGTVKSRFSRLVDFLKKEFVR